MPRRPANHGPKTFYPVRHLAANGTTVTDLIRPADVRAVSEAPGMDAGWCLVRLATTNPLAHRALTVNAAPDAFCLALEAFEAAAAEAHAE